MRANLLKDATAVVTGSVRNMEGAGSSRIFQGTVAGTGAVTAGIAVEGSIDQTNWVSIGTLTLSGTPAATDKVSSSDPWPFVRGRLTAITGTGAKANLWAAA
jgi:hypothetical protein